MLRTVTATRYVLPLREGGSLPGLMEADDLGTYVVKYSGAGQGLPVLVAEVVSGELARGLGLPVPELVTVELDPALGVSEPDQEVQDLLRRSPGRNLGMDFLPGALDLDPGAFPVDPEFAGRVLWFDALVYTPEALRLLVAVAGADRVALGTDHPFDMGITDPLDRLAAAGLDPTDAEQVRAGSAARLLAPTALSPSAPEPAVPGS